MSRENVPKMSSVCVAILINTSLANGHRIGAVTAVTYCFTQLIEWVLWTSCFSCRYANSVKADAVQLRCVIQSSAAA